jgi:ParB family transcriptional regulator, chromosome partitioning protein
MATKKKAALGRGLGALIDDAKYEQKQPQEQESQLPGLHEISVEKIDINPFQPRKEFDEESLKELADSISQLGIIQPITVRLLKDDTYQLISGERRLKASKIAGLETIPAFVREADDQGMLEMALVENVQRADLNAIEVSLAFNRLIDECKLTQENLSERIGKKRSTIANYLRLLKLPAEIQIGIRDKLITMGHARALINIEKPDDQLKIFYKVVNNGLSVRKTEELVKSWGVPKADRQKSVPANGLPEPVNKFRENLRSKLQSNIELKLNNNGKGKIVIPFNSDEHLQQIIQSLENKE